MSKSIKVLIADDHNVVREGLRILISSDPELEVAGEAQNGQEAIRMAVSLKPDVVIMDLAMPRANGLEATRAIQRQAPDTKVLVLSAYQDDETIRNVLETGASGYITKHSAASELLKAIRELGRGHAYFSSRVTGRIKARRRASFQNGLPRERSARLTPREQEVLCLIAQGHANKQIAYDLSLSIKTVEKHRQAVMDKLGIHEVAGLTRYAISKGLIPNAGSWIQETLPEQG